MNKFWKKIEHYNAKLIPLAIVLLLLIIIFELFIHIENHYIELLIKILDIFVIAVFVIDLIFLGRKAKNTSFFFKHYWLDILAIFPFSIFFNIITRLYRTITAAERLVVGQAVVHESLEIKKGISAASKSGRLAKMIRIAARFLRVVTKSRLFTQFESGHRKAGKNGYRKKVNKNQA